MFDALRDWLCGALRVPPKPAPPLGSDASLQVFRAAKNYYRYRLLGWALGLVFTVLISVGIVVAATLLGRELEGVPQQILFAAIIACLLVFAVSSIVSYLTLRLDYDMRWYMVTDRSIRIREGVWTVHEMTMTLANIQNISLSQGPIQRLLGISDLKVQSAGGGSSQGGEQHGGGAASMHEGYFRGIVEAEKIRDLMLARLREARDAGLGDEMPSARHQGAASGQAMTGPAVAAALEGVLAEARELRLQVSSDAR